MGCRFLLQGPFLASLAAPAFAGVLFTSVHLGSPVHGILLQLPKGIETAVHRNSAVPAVGAPRKDVSAGGTLACSLLTYVGAMRKALGCISKKRHVPVLKLQKKGSPECSG